MNTVCIDNIGRQSKQFIEISINELSGKVCLKFFLKSNTI